MNIHTFHIPVMGLAYTIDTPVKVAKYGINSVVSVIEDGLVERMRKFYHEKFSIPFRPINPSEEDYRARRITDYLNLLNTIVNDQFNKLKSSPFVKGSEIFKYFEMLPSKSELRNTFVRMLSTVDLQERQAMEHQLRAAIKPGSIDANIMTKVDRNNHDKNGNQITNASDAVSALRGYANSELTNSSIVFSAGLNPRLFNYLETLSAFHPNEHGSFDKKIVIKVSDYRSALIQGKYLAKKGIWVSEFRIESGLNCGGHAFATDGLLMGPILQEFKNKRQELIDTLHSLYSPIAAQKGYHPITDPYPISLTVQGGVGTSEEADFLASHYGVESTGWGTPFLMCPEATTVDDETLHLLKEATADNLILSKNSPLGIRFHYLKGTSAEKQKIARANRGRPGSPCTEKHLVSNTEFTKEPICTASYTYIKHKVKQLKAASLSPEDYNRQYNDTINKECLCVGLSNAAVDKYRLTPFKAVPGVTMCPGPNIAYFDEIVSLQTMTDHIYGRTNLLRNKMRDHVFINELRLNITYLKETSPLTADPKELKSATDFTKQLLSGIEYYKTIELPSPLANRFNQCLADCEDEVKVHLNNLIESNHE